jgi:fatty-acyl-CoA synthase
LKIVDPDGRRLPPGEIGQVCVRLSAGFLGYWNRPEANEKTIVDGWIHMGDVGYLDEDGYLFLRDRLNDTIIVAGQNIYPVEVENAIGTHPAVADVAVIGVPDERWGEVVQAFVVLHPGQAIGARALMVYLRGRIADYKIPTRYEFIDSLPRNSTGKVLRRVLREREGGRGVGWAEEQRRADGGGASAERAPSSARGKPTPSAADRERTIETEAVR